MRLDVYLVNHALVKSRSEATDLIKQGYVLVNGVKAKKSGQEIKDADSISVTQNRLYVSRAGEKLKEAIDTFDVDFNDLTVIDIGSSTGGFTDCALKHGATHVYAYDVGSDQMVEPLKSDERVSLFEQTNILDVKLPKHDIALIDVSFTSVRPILSHIATSAKHVIVLLKPQFETEGKFLKNGVLKDPKMHQHVIKTFMTHISELGFEIIGYTPSSLKGKDGNLEYLFYLTKRG